MRLRNQKGFSIVEVLIVVVIVGLIGWLGFTMVNRQQASVAEQSPTANDVQSAPTISSVADLDSAKKELDSDLTSGYAEDLAQLNSELSEF